jgi:hypothetical protein
MVIYRMKALSEPLLITFKAQLTFDSRSYNRGVKQLIRDNRIRLSYSLYSD